MAEKLGTGTNRKLLEEVIASPAGTEPTEKLETCDSAPVELTENPVISFEPWLATNRKLPPPSIVIAAGENPALVRGRTSVRAPDVESILNSEIVLSTWLATYKNRFEG